MFSTGEKFVANYCARMFAEWVAGTTEVAIGRTANFCAFVFLA